MNIPIHGKALQTFILLGFFILFPFRGTSPGSPGNEKMVGRTALILSGSFVKGEILVKYRKRKRTLRRIQSFFVSAFNKKWEMKRGTITRIPLEAGESVEEAILRVQSDPEVEYAQPNYIYRTCLLPDDPSFSKLWGLNNTGQNVNGTTGTADADMDGIEAWDVETGNPSVIVAVIDTGVDYNHPDLANNIWQNPGEIPGNSLDDDVNGYVDDVVGYDFQDGDNSPMDPFGHGTHVAGIIAAEGNNGTGITGVGWNLKIMILRAGDSSGFFLSSDLVEAINYGVENGARVINASWGGNSNDQAMRNAIENARTHGVLVVAAAGNSGRNIDSQPFYPASYILSNIVSVAATDQDDTLPSFSNFGAASVDVGAPGTNVFSTNVKRTVIWSDNFEDGNISDWTSGGANDTWGPTIEKGNSSPRSLTDSPFSSYQNDSHSWIRHAIDLTGQSGAVLTGVVRGTSEDGPDELFIQTSENGTTWNSHKISLVTGGNTEQKNSLTGILDSSWINFSVDLGQLDGRSGFIRFLFDTDSQTVDDGWYLDDLSIEVAANPAGSDLSFLQGTSMAAPYVSGIAGLLFSLHPEISPYQAGQMIIAGVDPLSSLAGTTLSGGRVNALSTLSVPVPPDESTGGGGCAITNHPSRENGRISGALFPYLILLILFVIFRTTDPVQGSKSDEM